METNRRVRTVTREMFAAWFPWVLRPLARRLIHATLDDALIEAFGFPRPSKPMRRLVASGLRLRGRFSGWLPRKKQPRLRTEMPHRTYPEGYKLESLGPSQGQSREEKNPTKGQRAVLNDP
jgi:hypothetical protein